MKPSRISSHHVHSRTSESSIFIAIFTLIPAVSLAAFFHAGLYLPARLGCSIFLALSLFALVRGVRTVGLGFLPYVMFVAYWLTNGILVMYIFDPSYSFYDGIPLTHPLTQDMRLIAMMAQIANVGILAYVSGVQFSMFLQRPGRARLMPPQAVAATPTWSVRPLNVPVALIICLACVVVYFISHPRGTILGSSALDIAANSAMLDSNVLGSGGVFYVIYALLYWLAIDVMYGRLDANRAMPKRIIAALGIFIVVFAIDFLGGRRGSVGVIVATVGAYILRTFHGGLGGSNTRKKFLRLAAFSVTWFGVAYFLGEVRYDLAHRNVDKNVIRNGISNFLATGTWMGGVSTNLVTMAFYQDDSHFRFLYGRTYLDYVMSLPPKQVANILNYERPLEADKSPNWWFVGYNAGGLSPTVIPFYNFGAFGVLAMMLAQGAFLAYAEIRARKWDLFGLMLYGGLCSVSLVWYWYGDMPLIRALMAFTAVGMLIRLMQPPPTIIRRLLTPDFHSRPIRRRA